MTRSGRSRILVAIKGLGIGGAERLIASGARYWDRQRFDYSVVYALPWKQHLVADITSLGIDVSCSGRALWTSVPSFAGFRRVVSRVRPDLIHAHLPSMGVVARVATSVPIIYTEHNMAESYHPVTRYLNRATYRRNAAVVAVSEAVARSVAGYPGPEPLVIENGVASRVDPADVSEARAALGVGPGAPLIVHVGNIRPGKGHDTLVEATESLVSLVPEVTVVSIGGEKRDGDMKRLLDLIHAKGLDGHLRLLGRREDPLPLVAAADVFVNPADVEGMPVALLEAMALGRPVVATAVGGVADLIRHEETGLLVPAAVPGDLAAALARILEDAALGSRLGRRAQDEVARRYGLEQMVNRVETLYDRVLAVGAAG